MIFVIFGNLLRFFHKVYEIFTSDKPLGANNRGSRERSTRLYIYNSYGT